MSSTALQPHKSISMFPEGHLLQAFAGGVGGTAGAVVTCPVEVIKTRLQSSAASAGFSAAATTKSRRFGEVRRCYNHILVTEGVRGLFRGIGFNLIGVAPARAIYFYFYFISKRFWNSRFPIANRDSPFVNASSACCAGFVSALLTSPFWMIKTRVQLNMNEGGCFTIARNIYRERGFFGFWRGFSASMMGISETVIQMVLYEYLKKYFSEREFFQEQGADSLRGGFLKGLFSSVPSAVIATTLAYPHETARTRLREPGNKYKKFWQTIRLVYREEGRRGLYRGLCLQLGRSVPNKAVVFAVYELVITFFS